MLKRIIRSIAVVVLVIALISSSTVAYAAEGRRQVGYNVQITQLSENKVQVVENGEISIIEVSQINGFVTEVRVSGPDNDTLVLTVDRNEKTITSSKTGETIELSELIAVEKESGTRYNAKTVTKKISFYKIKKKLGGVAGVATIASAIVVILTLAGFEVPEMIPTIIRIISGIASLVQLVLKGYKKQGLKIKLKSYLKKVHHGGKIYTIECWKVTSITKYKD